ncbi:amidase [Cupriavidus sp. L7L]|uniref:amidase n=1 Tax=Cupriavidus sp. L7L TaxID=2546443 RepID=UPI001404F207|nr:amidase [Cupriavidus sp. L7L]
MADPLEVCADHAHHIDQGDLTALTIAELGARLRQGTLSPVAIVEACLDRIEALDTRLHAFVTVTADQARAAARAAERRIRNGGYRSGMDGIPFAIKDNIDTAGIRTTSNSRLLQDHVPQENAHVVSLLEQAGAIVIGKVATWEFAQGGPCWDLPWPPPRNPWNVAHLAGGSSAGSGAAVAARQVPAALGTDTGGSLRYPAAVCGIVALKPTYGRTSRRGLHPNTFSLDHCGPMARTVEDCALLLGAMAGHDPRDPASIDEPVPDYRGALTGDISGLRIGLVRHWYAGVATPEVEAAMQGAVRTLERLGAHVEEVRLDALQDYIDCKTIIGLSELYAVHEGDLKRQPHRFGRPFRKSIIAGALLRAEDYVQALRWRTELVTRMFAKFRQVDLLLTAGWMQEAEPYDPAAGSRFAHRPPITMPFSLAGNPVLSVPCGYTAAGLPLGLQLAARPFDEATLLRAGDAFERHHGMRGFTPPTL